MNLRFEWKYPFSGPLNTIKGFYKMYVCQYVGLDIARDKTTWSISTKSDQTCIKTKPVYMDSDSSTQWSGGLVRQQTKDRRRSIFQPICNQIVFIGTAVSPRSSSYKCHFYPLKFPILFWQPVCYYNFFELYQINNKTFISFLEILRIMITECTHLSV